MSLASPHIAFEGREWPSDMLAAMAAGWYARVHERLPAAPEAVALVPRSHPETFALLFALSALPLPVVLLHPEPSTWRSAPPFPAAMPVFLSPATAALTPTLAEAGLTAVALPEPGPRAAAAPVFLATPGFVIFASGSTGVPKPGFRSTANLLRVVQVVAETYGLRRGSRIAGCLPLAASFGLSHNLFLPAYLGGRLGLLERFDHRSLLELFARGTYDYWPGTALMADLLVRARASESRSGRATDEQSVASSPRTRGRWSPFSKRRWASRRPGSRSAAGRRRRRPRRPASRDASGYARRGTARGMVFRRVSSRSPARMAGRIPRTSAP